MMCVCTLFHRSTILVVPAPHTKLLVTNVHPSPIPIPQSLQVSMLCLIPILLIPTTCEVCQILAAFHHNGFSPRRCMIDSRARWTQVGHLTNDPALRRDFMRTSSLPLYQVCLTQKHQFSSTQLALLLCQSFTIINVIISSITLCNEVNCVTKGRHYKKLGLCQRSSLQTTKFKF